MEARVIDFKQPLESNMGKINKVNNSDQTRNEDFIKKLNSARKNTESTHRESNEKVKKPKDEVVELVEEVEEPEKEEKILYEGMVNLLNIKPITEEEPEVDLEEVELTLLPVDGDQELPKDPAIGEEIINLTSPLGDENHLEKLDGVKELKGENLIKVDINTDGKEVKSEILTENTSKTEVNIKAHELDKNTPKTEENELIDNVINLEGKIGEEVTKEFNEDNQSSERKTDSRFDLVESSNSEEGLQVENESFVPFMKDGIEFSSDKPMEVEIPVEPKEVIKQIVDQVKFELSENKNEMKLTLKPAMLGEMTMNVEVAKNGIIARIMVDNYRTKEIIETNMVQLKEGIKDTGMEIKTFEVFVGNGSDFDQHNSSQFNLNQNNKKLRIKTKNNKELKDYEGGTIEEKTEPLNQSLEGGLNLLA